MSWRCAWCGKPHESNDPPCDSCGYNSFQRVDDEPESDTVDTGTTYVWECPNCGRTHVRNSPPCSRCGNPTLEKVEQRYEGTETISAPSWLEVAKPYAPIIVGLVVVVGLFATGIVPLSVLPGVGVDVPGEDSQAEGIDLEETAMLAFERIDADRTDAGELRYDSELEALATDRNQELVVQRYTDDEAELVDPSAYDLPCAQPQGVPVVLDGAITEYDDEDALATAIAEEGDQLEQFSGNEYVGIDVHVGPDGSVMVLYVLC